MATLDQTKVKVAVSGNSKLDLSSTHITSQNFMRLQPVYYRHMLPREHLRGSGNALTRLAPVAVPTYGRCRINLRSFFVPFRTIFPNWNEFITDTIGSNYAGSSLISGSPYFYNYDLVMLFVTGVDSANVPLSRMLVSTDPDDAAAIAAGAYDFSLGNGHYVLSPLARHFMKILNSLGYRVIWDSKSSSMMISALALLAYAKVYADWYANQAYLDSQEYLSVQRLFKFNNPTSALHLDAGEISNILGWCSLVCYDTGNDVFTNAWDNPVAPNSGNFTSFSGNDITNPPRDVTVEMYSNGTPYMKQGSAVTTAIGTQYLHDFLKSATDYIKRNQLSGAAQIDRFLTRFGVNLDSAKFNRSIYVSSKSIDVEFGSVMQTANTNSQGVSNLGDYAGQGIGKGQFSFDFETDEFGIFIVTSSIVPAGSLYQGYDRNNFHLDKLSFFTPEFDSLGCSAISKAEVYVSANENFSDENGMQGVFGYAPRYYEYKQKLDYVTGDIQSPSAMIGGDSWHLNRILDDSMFGGSFNGLVHSLDFTRGADAGQYDRIFNYENSDYDKFYVVYHFDVMGLAPCKSLFDTYDFDSAGQSLSINGNSAKVN